MGLGLLTELTFDISNDMTLSEIKPKSSYRILQISVDGESVVATRLRQLGFIPGEEFLCEAVAPLVKNPFLVRIRGLSIALARHEAEHIRIEQVKQ